jgi:hypothetical protein
MTQHLLPMNVVAGRQRLPTLRGLCATKAARSI